MKAKTKIEIFADHVLKLLKTQDVEIRLPSGFLRPAQYSPDQVWKAIIEVAANQNSLLE